MTPLNERIVVFEMLYSSGGFVVNKPTRHAQCMLLYLVLAGNSARFGISDSYTLFLPPPVLIHTESKHVGGRGMLNTICIPPSPPNCGKTLTSLVSSQADIFQRFLPEFPSITSNSSKIPERETEIKCITRWCHTLSAMPTIHKA